MSDQKIKYYKILSYFLSIGFIILSGCKSKNVETSESGKYRNKPNNSFIDTTAVNNCQAIYGVLQIIYQPIEKEPDIPFIDE